jgi:nucleoside-diphosphate-sugar epimerase
LQEVGVRRIVAQGLAYAYEPDAPPPRRLPTFLTRLAAGGWGVIDLTSLRGADNTRARLTLDWQPRHRSWRTGLARQLAAKAAR